MNPRRVQRAARLLRPMTLETKRLMNTSGQCRDGGFQLDILKPLIQREQLSAGNRYMSVWLFPWVDIYSLSDCSRDLATVHRESRWMRWSESNQSIISWWGGHTPWRAHHLYLPCCQLATCFVGAANTHVANGFSHAYFHFALNPQPSYKHHVLSAIVSFLL